MSYQGDINLGDTIDFKFTSVNATGVPTSLAGTPALAAYVDNVAAEITAGVTLTADFDARAGLNHVRVVASGANGFAPGTNVSIVITAGTVGGNSVVGYEVGSFSIEKRSGARPGAAMTLTAAYDKAKAAASPAEVNSEVDAALADVGLTSAVTGRLDTSVSSRAAEATAASRASQASVDAIKAKTDQLGFVSGDVRATLDGEGVAVAVNNDKTGYELAAAYDAAKNASNQASVNTILTVTNRLDSALELDGAAWRYTANALEMAPAGSGDWADSEKQQIRNRLGLDGVAALPVAAPTLATQASVVNVKAVTDKLNTALEVDGAVYRFTENALEMAPAGGGFPEPPDPTLENPCAQNPARTRGPTTQPIGVFLRR